jgi:hypothetical protein
MTIQEFVSHEAIKYKTVSPLVKQGFSNGLTKGLEIADEFGDWTLYNNWEKHSNGKWMNDDFLTIPTTSELLTIFLTEKYGNNG